MNFTILKKKGYDPQEVDAYIKKISEEYEDKLNKQKNRIFDLKNELQEKDKALDELKSQSDLISRTLIEAVKQAGEIEKLSVARYREELQHLKVFHDKWVKYYTRIVEKYPADEDLKSVRDFNNKMRSILSGNTAEKLELERYYDAEFKRITKAEKDREKEKFEKKVEDSLNEKDAASEKVSFDYDAARNPQEGLDQILKDLGIYEE